MSASDNSSPGKMICPYCRTEIQGSDGTVAFCSGCGTPHHRECYAENGGCTLFGCKCAPPDEPKVQVTNVDVSTPAWPQAGYPQALPPAGYGAQGNWGQQPGYPPIARVQPTGFGDVSSGAPVPGTFRPPQAAPVYGQPVPLTPASVYSSYPPTVSAPSTPQPIRVPKAAPKSRIAYILLGLFLGFLGVHNFYAGFAKRGLIQLCLTICTLFIALFVIWIWAIVEVCTVDRDNNGIIFA